MTGGSTSLTTIVCEQVAILPDVSVALKMIIVVPTGYGAFKDCPSLRVPTIESTAQLSVAVAAPGLTVAEHRPGSLPTVMLAGQVITGFSLSLTVTLKLQVSVAPTESVAVH